MISAIIQRGTLTTVIVLIVSVLGIVAALRIPVQMIPDLDVRVISIRTFWPGATPQDIEKEILIEQEEYLRNLPNLQRITASTRSSRAEIELEFPFGTDITEMMIRVSNALSQVPSYPENVDEPVMYASSFSSNSFMFFRVQPLPGNPRNLDMDLMRDFLLDNVKPAMAGVPGISEVGIWGGARRQIQILIDPARLAQRRLTVADVRSAIRARNRDRSGGEIEAGKRRYLLRTVGRFEDLAELEQLILRRDGDRVLRLGDVARIKMDHFEKDSNAWVNDSPIIFVTLRREAGSNVVDARDAVFAAVPAINRDILHPAGLELQHTANDVRYVEESISNVWQNLMLGALFASLVMAAFLRSARATLVGVMGIPICTIAAFIGLMALGRTVNVISLAGVAFAIGMTLDNTIVVLESIALERRRGLDRFEASVAGVRQVWPAVLASTATTILVFLPIAFVEQEAGQLYSDIGIAVSAAILASMLVAITVVPTATARLRMSLDTTLEHDNRQRSAFVARLNAALDQRAARLAIIGFMAAGSLSAIVFLTPPAEYLPEGEEPKLFASMNAPPGYNLSSMDEIATDLRAYFLPFVEDDPGRFDRGEVAVPAMRYLNMHVRLESIRLIVEPIDPAHTDALLDVILAKYREYPGMRVFGARGSIISSNNGGTRSINLDISGARLETIYKVAGSVYERAEQVFDSPRIRTEPASLALAQPMLEVRPNWERAAELGLTADTVGLTVAALTDGSYVDEFFLDDDKIDIYLYSAAGQRANLQTIPLLPVYTPSGAVVPLSAIAAFHERVDTAAVRRVNGRRTVTLGIIPPADMPLESGVELVRSEVIDHLRTAGAIPADVSITLSGAADALDATRQALAGNYLVALIVIYLLLVAIFTHWGYPLLIMTAIPLGVAGGILGLWLLNAIGIRQSFDMISMLGFLILMGTVVNNPILIVHRTIDNIRVRGMEVVVAVQEALDARIRPIAMSTITTICGLAPLVLIPGAGTELYRGVGVIVMFGILGSALVTVTVLPALTIEVLQLRRQLAERSA